MPRPSLATRTATDDDIPVLIGLWQELKQVGARAEKTVVVTEDGPELLSRFEWGF